MHFQSHLERNGCRGGSDATAPDTVCDDNGEGETVDVPIRDQKACEQEDDTSGSAVSAGTAVRHKELASPRLTSKTVRVRDEGGPRLRTVGTEAWKHYPSRGGGGWWMGLLGGEWCVWVEGRGVQQLALEYVNQKWFLAHDHVKGGCDWCTLGFMPDPRLRWFAERQIARSKLRNALHVSFYALNLSPAIMKALMGYVPIDTDSSASPVPPPPSRPPPFISALARCRAVPPPGSLWKGGQLIPHELVDGSMEYRWTPEKVVDGTRLGSLWLALKPRAIVFSVDRGGGHAEIRIDGPMHITVLCAALVKEPQADRRARWQKTCHKLCSLKFDPATGPAHILVGERRTRVLIHVHCQSGLHSRLHNLHHDVMNHVLFKGQHVRKSATWNELHRGGFYLSIDP